MPGLIDRSLVAHRLQSQLAALDAIRLRRRERMLAIRTSDQFAAIDARQCGELKLPAASLTATSSGAIAMATEVLHEHRREDREGEAEHDDGDASGDERRVKPGPIPGEPRQSGLRERPPRRSTFFPPQPVSSNITKTERGNHESRYPKAGPRDAQQRTEPRRSVGIGIAAWALSVGTFTRPALSWSGQVSAAHKEELKRQKKTETQRSQSSALAQIPGDELPETQ